MLQPDQSKDHAYQVLQIIPDVVLLLGHGDRVLFANHAAENFFRASVATLTQTSLQNLIPHDNPVLSMVQRVRRIQNSMTEYALSVATPKIGHHAVTANAVPVPDAPEQVLLTLVEHNISNKVTDNISHKGTARSISALAAMLAHEVKNPLSGIRGAAQLIESMLSAEDRSLSRLIIDETDRIVKILDRMDGFSDRPFLERAPVNIHEILDHVKHVAQTGFGKKVQFFKNFDPSLPPVFGDKDQLIQIFLNLVKNACEAADEKDPRVYLTTAFRHGVKLAIPASDARQHLPLMVGVADNGAGIQEDIRPYLFDPFITSKKNGNGLGLALVAKLVGDHGGMVDLDARSDLTRFNVFLPMLKDEKKPRKSNHIVYKEGPK